MDRDDVAMLNAEVVAHHPVDAGATIVQVIVVQNNQDSILPLLALDQHGVTTEELERLHGVVR